MRVSDREREVVVEQLRGHAAAGRLDVDELGERIEAAYAAKTDEQLARVGHDLPAPDAQPEEGADGFASHLRVFLAVNALLVVVWALSGAGYFWPVWPFFGWGIGIVAHGLCRPHRSAPARLS
jgi:hypothetical protein